MEAPALPRVADECEYASCNRPGAVLLPTGQTICSVHNEKFMDSDQMTIAGKKVRRTNDSRGAEVVK